MSSALCRRVLFSSCVLTGSSAVRFIHLYLVGYFLLVLGACLVLWQAGVLARVPVSWLLISGIVVVALGVLLAVTSVGPTVTRE